MLSRLARRVPSHCASDIAASGTSSGGQTPWFTTRMSSPPSARAASSTARLAPTGSPRSAWTATVSFRPLPPPTALIVSSASAFLLRYPTATLAPARASRSAAALADQGDDGDAAGARRLRGADHVGALPARRVEREYVARARQGVELPREHFVEAHVVGAGGKQRRVGGERQGAQRGAARLIADHVLGREMLGVGGAAAVAGEEQRPARAQRDLVALRDGGDGGRVLGRHPCGEGGEHFQSLAGPLRPAHAVIP